MMIERIVGLHHASRTTLRCDSMTAHRVDFRDQRDLDPAVGFCRSDRGPQARTTSADDSDIGFDQVHAAPLIARDVMRARSNGSSARAAVTTFD